MSVAGVLAAASVQIGGRTKAWLQRHEVIPLAQHVLHETSIKWLLDDVRRELVEKQGKIKTCQGWTFFFFFFSCSMCFASELFQLFTFFSIQVLLLSRFYSPSLFLYFPLSATLSSSKRRLKIKEKNKVQHFLFSITGKKRKYS